MKISTKGRYSLLVMIDLTENKSDDFIPLRDIAKRQDISEKYLESIIKLLVKNKLVVGLRGKGGGYKLTGHPSDITVGEVLRIAEENIMIDDEDTESMYRTSEYRTIVFDKSPVSALSAATSIDAASSGASLLMTA